MMGRELGKNENGSCISCHASFLEGRMSFSIFKPRQFTSKCMGNTFHYASTGTHLVGVCCSSVALLFAHGPCCCKCCLVVNLCVYHVEEI